MQYVAVLHDGWIAQWLLIYLTLHEAVPQQASTKVQLGPVLSEPFQLQLDSPRSYRAYTPCSAGPSIGSAAAYAAGGQTAPAG